MKIVKATFETTNFLFESYGTSKKTAARHLINGLIQHAEEYGLPKHWYRASFANDAAFIDSEVHIQDIELAAVYRDRQQIIF